MAVETKRFDAFDTICGLALEATQEGKKAKEIVTKFLNPETQGAFLGELAAESSGQLLKVASILALRANLLEKQFNRKPDPSYNYQLMEKEIAGVLSRLCEFLAFDKLKLRY